MTRLLYLLILWISCLTAPALASDIEVHTVVFSSPACPFCSLVSERDLGPLQSRYPDSLTLHVIDVSTSEGAEILASVWDLHQAPDHRRGVPSVIIGEHLLVGAGEIGERLPDLVRDGLARGGLPPPPLAGLEIATHDPTTPELEWWQRIHNDVPGNYVAIALLVAFLIIGGAMIPVGRWQDRLALATPLPIKIGVACVGLGAALYLSWGETTEQELVCGPIGQCNIVQHSDMAMLWGLGPLAVMGALAYSLILVVYIAGVLAPDRIARWIPAALLIMSGPGFLFSVLLTFWQPFVIGATCAWCLISAITMTLTCLFSLGSGRARLLELLRPTG